MKEQVSLIDQDTEQVKVRDERLKDSCDSKEDWEISNKDSICTYFLFPMQGRMEFEAWVM